MKRVLVTGATGFVGRHSLRPLQQRGFDVHAITSAPPPQAADGLTWHRADLLDRQATATLVARLQPTHLLHLAWYTEHGLFWSSPLNLRWAAASLDLVESFHTAGGRRVVMAGTGAEYGRSAVPCVERVTPLTPGTVYGASKHALRLGASDVCRRNGLSFGWGRIFLTFGPDEHPRRLVPAVVRALLADEAANCSHGNQVRDFLAAEEIGAAFAALLDSDVGGEVNIASGEARAIKDVVEMIGRELGRSHLIRLGAIQAPADEAPILVADATRLREEVGWTPSRPLEAALRSSIAWWQKQMVTVPEYQQ